MNLIALMVGFILVTISLVIFATMAFLVTLGVGSALLALIKHVSSHWE